MSKAFRCSGIGDLRTWLDCYYGAAQPVRASLGLSPAPASQQGLVANPPAGAEIVEPELRNRVLSNAFQCGSAGAGRAWLDCYYAAANPARIRLGLGSAVPPSQVLSKVQFGDDRRQDPGSDVHQPDRLIARMMSYSFGPLHTFTVVLDNGQTWKQVAGDTVQADWKKPAPNYTVVITHGFFGSFNMQVKGRSPLFKVVRTF